jgi:hypothetical protein
LRNGIFQLTDNLIEIGFSLSFGSFNKTLLVLGHLGLPVFDLLLGLSDEIILRCHHYLH